ncbi:MAG: FAD-dependent oxidoreductase, partial [Candidatus Stahlbacteria bacterium]|nr:FAD-dependent oxidoreductase [Candidatus Stahlbacteria bacterium]
PTTDNRQPTTDNRQPTTDKKVAIVGAGPCGLTAAYYLAQLGANVTVFDSLPNPGGMLLSAIPRYRLPMEVIRKEIGEVLKIGIEFRGNTTLGSRSSGISASLQKDITLDELLNGGYDAIFLATGAGISKKVNIEGISAGGGDSGGDANGVLWGIEFLMAIKESSNVKAQNPNEFQMSKSKVQKLNMVPQRHENTKVHKKIEDGRQETEVRNQKVIVVGGGNVAIDAALSALRLGAKEVVIYCLEAQDEMPAYTWEINQALEEGIVINCGWGPKRILQDRCDLQGKVVGVEFIKCISVFSAGGRSASGGDAAHNFNPLYDESITISTTADIVILAIGQEQDLSFLPIETRPVPTHLSRRTCPDAPVPTHLSRRTCPDAEWVGRMGRENGSGEWVGKPKTLISTIPGVFFGGDMIRGPSSVVKAIADGRQAASLIAKYLGSDGNLGEPSKELSNPYLGKEEGFADKPRVNIPCLPIDKRRGNFNQVELGLSEAQAVEEAKRCLKCDLRFDMHSATLPPEPFIDFLQSHSKMPKYNADLDDLF